MQEVTTKHILSQQANWLMNKKLTSVLESPMAAFLLSILIDKEDYHSTKGELITRKSRKWFYATEKYIQSKLYIGYRGQKAIIKILVDNELIYQAKYGTPGKQHFAIRHNKIVFLITSSFDKKAKQVLTSGNNSIITKNKVTKNKVTKSAIPSQATEIANTETPKKIDGLKADPSFKMCLDVFHEKHKAFHSTEEDKIELTWSKKERGNLNRICKNIRKAYSVKNDIKLSEVTSEKISNSLSVLLNKIENLQDKWTVENFYTPSGIYSQWNQIINKIQSNKNGNTSKPKSRTKQDINAVVNEQQLMAAVNAARDKRNSGNFHDQTT